MGDCKTYTVKEPIVMMLGFPKLRGTLQKVIKDMDVDFKDNLYKESIILEMLKDNITNNYMMSWLCDIAVIPGIDKTYPDKLDIIESTSYEVAYISYNDLLLAIYPVNNKVDGDYVKYLFNIVELRRG